LSGNNLQNHCGELTVQKSFTNKGSGVLSHDPQFHGKFGMKLVSDEFHLEQYNQEGEKG